MSLQQRDIKTPENTNKAGQSQSVHQKFTEAFENMQSFHNMISKFSTRKVEQTQQKPTTKPKVLNQYNNNQLQSSLIRKTTEQNRSVSGLQNNTKSEHSKIIQFGNGWCYSGKTLDGKFHGYGIIVCHDDTVYSGQFRLGQFHGRGKLKHHPDFQELIDTSYSWELYEGQFCKGNATGFGNLYLANNTIVTGYWNKGKPQFTIDTLSLCQ